MGDQVNRKEIKRSHHHILDYASSLNVFLFLLVFTVITVAVAQFDFGAANFPIAMLIATAKAMAVMLFFMGLKYENNENRAIFFSGYAFLLIFLAFVITDYFARSDTMRLEDTPPLAEATGASGGPSFDQPWQGSEAIIEHGRELYLAQACQTCHGNEGAGDGPAGIALAARNFQIENGWKNGPSVHAIYKTLTNGLNAMPAYPTLTPTDRLALAHYVQTFMKFEPPVGSAGDFEQIGIDISKPDGGLGGEQQRSLPIDFALERYITN